jgi:hypothetical protein
MTHAPNDTLSLHARFVAPARARPQLWRLLLGIVLILVIYFAGILALLGAIWLIAGFDAMVLWAGRLTQGQTPAAVLFVLASFTFMALGPMLVARLLHKRGPGTLFGPWRDVARGFAMGAGVVGGLIGLSALVMDLGFTPLPNVPLGLWLMVLPLALLGLLIQTGAEEILFRGYLQQQLAARFASPLAWAVLPSLLFGLLHFNAGAPSHIAWLTVAATGLFGMIAADLTRVTGNIGLAWGFHFANNVFALLVIALSGPLSGLALYTTPFSAAQTDTLLPLIARDMAATVAFWAVLRGLLYWRAKSAAR